MTDFKVGGESIVGSDAVFGQLNPSQPGIMFNSDDYQVIRGKLLAVDATAECDENKCSYLGQCTESLFKSLPTLSFTFDSTTYELEPEDYSVNGGATCDVLLGKHNADRHFYTLGDSFISRFPVTMNYDDMTMTFNQFVDTEDISLL